MSLRELKYVLLGEDRLSSHLDRVSKSGTQATRSLKENSLRLTLWRSQMRDAATEIPGLNSGLRLMTNPLALAGAGILALGSGLMAASREARKFNHDFRELGNLNLDKSRAEVKELKDLVLDTAFNNGFDLSKTNTGMFDVQSITGRYGTEAAKIVGIQGEFANVMNADFNEWIAGTGKAMANFGFGAEQLDRFNASAYATMKAGYINFDQLAKVMSVYAGAAASAKQDFNTANKMLTLFTLKTKSADESATLTKSLFNDLTKKTTIDAFTKAGINVYDANKQFKQADTLLFELNAKFRALNNDKAIINLKNQFSGSEGLIALVQAATDKTGALQSTMAGFNNADLNLNEAMRLAREDVDYINNQLQARTKVLMAEIGNNWTPIWNSILSGANDVLGGVRAAFTGREGKQQWGRSYIAGKFLGVEDKVPSMSDDEYGSLLNQLRSMRTLYQQREEQGRDSKKWYNYATDLPDLSNRRTQHDFDYGALGRINQTIRMVTDARHNSVVSKDGAAQTLFGGTKGGTTGTTGTATGASGLTSSINAIAGGGTQVRNITVNIAKLIESQNITTSTIKESATDIQRIVEEAMIRAVSGAEQTLAY